MNYTNSTTKDLEIINFLRNLQKLIKQPSISSKNEGLTECAQILSEIMSRSGINNDLVYLDDNKKIPPIIFGEVKSKHNPLGKTLLFYNHYDVQPVEPINLWNEKPFSGKVIGNKIFGRGSSDDKGEILTRIKAVENIIKNFGDVPCNIKFLIEGEEEIGSPNLFRYIQKLKNRLKCYGLIWEFGYVDSNYRPIINLGMKGMLYVEIISRGPAIDLHSSLAVLVKNPAWNLINLLNSMWENDNGKILINNWYDDVESYTNEEKSFILHQPHFDEIEFKNKYGIRNFLKNRKGNDVKFAIAYMPTCNISGLEAGHIGKGAKTIIPSIAKAKIDFRLVPNMSPQKQFNKLKAHLNKHGGVNFEVKYIHGVKASRTKFTHDFVKIVVKSAEKTFGKKPLINLSSAGSGPMSLFVNILNCPSVAVGCTLRSFQIFIL